MILAVFLVCIIALAASTLLLLLGGGRWRVASRTLSVVIGACLAAGAAWLGWRVWSLPTTPPLVAAVLLTTVTCAVAVARPRWNTPAHLFAGTALTASVVYLAFGFFVTLSGALSAAGTVVSGLLLVLETVALVLSASFAFESLEILCSVRPTEREPRFDPGFVPMVSLHIAAYNEPPDMLIQTIRSAQALDYPRFEVVVVDNNTTDEEVWGPVARYCETQPNVTFVHVDPWPGYKSGALNLALREHTHPDAELIGVIDADYLVDPRYLRSLVGYFADPNLAFVQTPQDYRAYEDDAYLTACYDAYRYFFLTTMPVRNRRNSIIFAGTMGLLRRSVLERIEGWDEWCITEDAEASLRILRRGYAGLFVGRSFGRGIMPLSFGSLKSQRFRWCFGGMQILRMHWRDLVPWNRDPSNHLTRAQRIDYLLGGLQWMNDLVLLGFSVVLLALAAGLATGAGIALRPLLGVAALLPVALIASGLLRALWALRTRARIGWRRASLAFANWLSLSWTVALACVQGLFRREGVFLRTPKEGERANVLTAVWTARTETLLAVALWGSAGWLLMSHHAGPVLAVVFAWQGAAYASAPYMAWLNQHTELSAQLERRRRSEWMRERAARAAPVAAFGAGVAILATSVIALAVILGGGPSHENRGVFSLPRPSPAHDPPATAVPIASPTGAPGMTPAPTTPPGVSPSASTSPSASAPPTSAGATTPAPTTASPTADASASTGATPTPSPTASAIASPTP